MVNSRATHETFSSHAALSLYIVFPHFTLSQILSWTKYVTVVYTLLATKNLWRS